MTDTADFFRSRLDQMIDLRHPLAVLASRMPWQELEASIAHLFAKAVRAGQKIEDVDLFGGVVSTQRFPAQVLTSKGNTCEHSDGRRHQALCQWQSKFPHLR